MSGDRPQDDATAREQDASGFAGFTQLSQLVQLVSSMDAAGLVTGVGQALTWARESVITPHAAHEDPAAHPECVLCRGMAMVQSATGPLVASAGASAGPSAGGSGAEQASETETIRWVPVTRLTRPDGT